MQQFGDDIAYLDSKVGMEQALKVEGLVALVLHMQLHLQLALAQCDAVDQAEVVWPLLLRILTEHSTTQAEVQLDTVVGLGIHTLAAALSQELPNTVSRKAMLW